MKDYIVLNGADATYTNNRLQWNLSPNAYFTHLPQNGNVDIYMKLKAIRFRVRSDDDDAVDGTCLIDTNIGLSNLRSTNGINTFAVVETFLKDSTSPVGRWVSPAQIQSDISLNISKINTIALGVYYDNDYMDLDGNKDNFNAVLEISYIDNTTKELK